VVKLWNRKPNMYQINFSVVVSLTSSAQSVFLLVANIRSAGISSWTSKYVENSGE
jgi:hypothetical protein